MAATALGMGMVLGTLGVLLVVLRAYQFWGSPHPEVVRKLLHMGMGLVTLSFPWIFAAPWPVIALAGLSIIGLVGLRITSAGGGLGAVVAGVNRISWGEVYFPIAVAILFVLYCQDETPSRIVLYCVPIMLLAFADAAAALVGVGYGCWRYPTSDGEKSVEGSVAFFTLAFFCVHVPILLWTDAGRGETLLIAVLLAWLAMMFEAISWRGLDNLVLPLVTHLLLRLYLHMSIGELELRLIVTAGLTLFLFAFRQQTTLAGSAHLGAALVGYISWALGGWPWLLAPLVLIITYTLLSPRTEANSRRIHNIHSVVSVSSAGLVWLFLAQILSRGDFLLPYTIAFAGHLAIIGIARLKFDTPTISGGKLLSLCILRGWMLLMIPYVLTLWRSNGLNVAVCYDLAAGLGGTTLAALGFYVTQPGLDDCPLDTARWLRQAAWAGLGSLMGLLPSLFSQN